MHVDVKGRESLALHQHIIPSITLACVCFGGIALLSQTLLVQTHSDVVDCFHNEPEASFSTVDGSVILTDSCFEYQPSTMFKEKKNV